MEIKDKLNKPCSNEERMNFIVRNNYELCYEIRETGEAIEAWGYTEEEKRKREEERINNLTMTALDFVGVLQSFGLTLEQINAYLESNLPVKMQLTYCQNVYCGVAKSLMPIEYEGITITAQMVEDAFKQKGV